MSYIDPQQVIIHGKNLVVTDAIKNYVLKKLEHLELFGEQKAKVNVAIEKQKLQHSCEIFFTIDHIHVKVHGSTDEMYSAIDKASDRLRGKLRKYKTRLQQYHNKPLNVVEMSVSVLQAPESDLKEVNEQIDEKNEEELYELYRPHEIKNVDTMPLKTLTQAEAVMKMDLSGAHFLIYRSEEDQKIRILYRREDGNYGLVQPE